MALDLPSIVARLERDRQIVEHYLGQGIGRADAYDSIDDRESLIAEINRLQQEQEAIRARALSSSPDAPSLTGY